MKLPATLQCRCHPAAATCLRALCLDLAAAAAAAAEAEAAVAAEAEAAALEQRLQLLIT